jgi:hypothetical protein
MSSASAGLFGASRTNKISKGYGKSDYSKLSLIDMNVDVRGEKGERGRERERERESFIFEIE